MRLSILRDIFLNSILPVLTSSCLYFMSVNLYLTGFLRNQLPDGLWAYALISCILIIWKREINFYWVCLIFMLFILFEGLQYLHFISGTGDWLDIITYFIFSGISFTKINVK